MTLDYHWLYDTVRKRFESDEAMEAFLPKALAPEELKQKGDDRYLSAMSQRVFQAGMQHSGWSMPSGRPLKKLSRALCPRKWRCSVRSKSKAI